MPPFLAFLTFDAIANLPSGPLQTDTNRSLWAAFTALAAVAFGARRTIAHRRQSLLHHGLDISELLLQQALVLRSQISDRLCGLHLQLSNHLRCLRCDQLAFLRPARAFFDPLPLPIPLLVREPLRERVAPSVK